jgi:hypothetical protein
MGYWKIEKKKKQKTKKKVYYIKEPFGLPFELTQKDTFKKLKK